MTTRFLRLLLAAALAAPGPAAAQVRLSVPLRAPAFLPAGTGILPALSPSLSAPAALAAPMTSEAALPRDSARLTAPRPAVLPATAVALPAPAVPVAVAAVPAALPTPAAAPTAFESARALSRSPDASSARLWFDGARPAALNAAVDGRPAGFRDETAALLPSSRGLASVVAVSPRNFEYRAETEDSDDLLDEMTAIKDPETRRFHLLTTRGMERVDVLVAYQEAFPGLPRERVEELAARAPALARAHFESTLTRHAHSTTERAGASVHEVRDGLAFWADLVLAPDPETRAAASAFVQGGARRIFSKDAAYGLAAALTQGLDAVTRVVDSAALSASDRRALVRLAQARGLAMARHGRWLLVGSGAGFHLTDGVLRSARDLSDPLLEARLDKVLSFLAREGVDIDQDQHLAAAAFFHPLDNRMAFVMPSRADLNVFTHEGTHARFHRFEEALERWLRGRRQAMPYEADGPAVGLIGRGGYMNLLNELNSWRLGESFDGGKTDAGILAVLRDSYGRQAGEAAAADFARLWPEERVSGVSVPRLIRRSIGALNALSAEEAVATGTRALAEGDPAGQRNVLRLWAARHPDGAGLGREERRLAAALAERGADEGVRGAAERLLGGPDEDAPAPRADRRRARRAYAAAAEEWMEGLARKGDVIPFDLTWGAQAVFRFAHEKGLSDYDAAIRGLQRRFGRGEVEASDSERALFERVASRRGKSLEAKLRGYIRAFNAQGFPSLWEQFAKAPDYDLRQLLVEKHKDAFGPAHAAQLARWALDGGTAESLRTEAAGLLGELLDALGFGTIYPSHQLASLQAMQRAMNARSGLPADAHMPKNRAPAPGHWLFSPEVDAALAAGMFDGRNGTHRLKLIELITQRTYPEELPLLRRRLAEVLTDDAAHRLDHWVARMFLVPADSILYDAHAVWGWSAARAALEDPTPSATALEFVGEHLRLGLGSTLKGPSWGRSPKRALDAAARREAAEAVAAYSAEDAALYRRALDDLWRLLSEVDPKVSKAALYAVAARPVYFLGLEERIAAELAGPGSPRRALLFDLLAMTRPGFSRALEAWAAPLRGRLAPSAAFPASEVTL